ncbi:hypothetical protein FACS1894216_01400 [Synergistales bacterium]|nr:hypothetical protein FACS1894216_01400 [Synergistales bacterium]
MGAYLNGQKIARPYLNGVRHNAYLNGQKIWNSPPRYSNFFDVFIPFSATHGAANIGLNGGQPVRKAGTGAVVFSNTMGALFPGQTLYTIDPFVLTSTDWSMSVWYNPKGVSGYHCLFDIKLGGTDVCAMQFNGTALGCYVWGGGTVTYSPVQAVGIWAHYCLNSDGTFYVNGVYQSTKTPGTKTIGSAIFGIASDAKGNYIGRSAYGYLSNLAFIQGRRLTASEISGIYEAGHAPAELSA